VIFKEDFFVGPDIEAVLDESLFTEGTVEVSPQHIKSVVPGAESNVDQNVNAKEIVKGAKERVSKAERDAIFIMLSKYYKSKSGKLEAAPIANMLNSDAKDILPGREFSPETIRRWLKSIQ
jgi:BioD-like phosphotransacetylase family protein